MINLHCLLLPTCLCWTPSMVPSHRDERFQMVTFYDQNETRTEMSAWMFSCSDSLRTSQNSLVCDSDFPSPVNHLLSKLTKVILYYTSSFSFHSQLSQSRHAKYFTAFHNRTHPQSGKHIRICLTFSFLRQHMRSPSVSCLDVDTSPPTNDSTAATLTPSTTTKSHRRSASCGNNPSGNSQSSGSDMHIIRIRMDLQDGNLYRSILVRSLHICRHHIIPSHTCLSQIHKRLQCFPSSGNQ